MKTMRFGKTGLEVSRMGMGGIPLTRPTEAEAIKLIQRALDLGVNFIDTAYGYGGGMSEERIGKAIVGRREQVIIATKGWSLEQLETSLRRLNTDYIDLWQFHNISSFDTLDRVLDRGIALVQGVLQKGLVRHVGFSSHSLKVALKAVASGLFETVQFPLNFVSNEAADELVPLAREHDVGFIAMKPFAGGRIKDANLAIKYLLQFEGVVPDPGVQKIKEIEEIVGIVNGGAWELTGQEWQEMEKIRARVGPRFCRQCEYCMPCPQGVHIAGAVYLPILWEGWPPDWYFSWGYVKNAVKSAQNCVQCGECEAKCPYNLPIREMIVESLEFYERVAAEHNSCDTQDKKSGGKDDVHTDVGKKRDTSQRDGIGLLGHRRGYAGRDWPHPPTLELGQGRR
jgi:predicted aldo/keto reductase-like oxidoreductase